MSERSSLRHELRQHLALAARAEHDVLEAELGAAGLRDRALLTGHQRDEDAASSREGDTHAVVCMEGLELVASLGEDHAAIREHAVDIEDEQTDAPRPRSRVSATQQVATASGRILHDQTAPKRMPLSYVA